MCDYYLKRQAKCLNCKLIYYTYLVQRGDNYCSIDCNTNHNYLKNIVKIIKNKINELNDTEINEFFQFIKEDITEPSPILIDYIFNELKFNNDY